MRDRIIQLILLPLNAIIQTFIYAPEISWLAKVNRDKEKELIAFLKNHSFPTDLLKLRLKWQKFLDNFQGQLGDEFYINWKQEIGAEAVAANVFDQLSRPHWVRMLHNYLPKNIKNLKLLDYGCGSGVLSIEIVKEHGNCQIYLADIENLNKDFIKYQTKGVSNFYAVDINLDVYIDNYFDMIICSNVLEHLPNPSEVFIRLSRKLKINGLLLLEAPWGGTNIGHLPEAIIDWKLKGGENKLVGGYKKVQSFYLYPVRYTQGLYRKIN